MSISKGVICPRCGYNGGGGVVKKYRLLSTNEDFYLCDECSTVWISIFDLKSKIIPLIFDFDYFEQRNLDIQEFDRLTFKINFDDELKKFSADEIWESPKY